MFSIDSKTIVNLIGWIPAIIFPSATFLQLIKIIKDRTVEGVSVSAWGLFGIANVSSYFYMEKYTSPQSIIGFLGTAIFDFCIVGLVLFWKHQDTHSE